jgi:hypothetical protein
VIATRISICNLVAAASWVLLVAAPTSPRMVKATTVAVPAAFALLYCGIMAVAWHGANGGFGSLAGVGALFEDPWVRLAGWIHYLAFDLFIGGWMVREADARAVPRLLMIPCLLLTFLFGPAGLLCFFLILIRWQGPAAPVVQ